MKVADANQPVPAGRLGPAQVLPLQSMITRSKPPRPTNRATKLQLAVALFNWVVWLLVVLVLSQFLSVFWSTITMNSSNDFGQSPLKGTGSISGINDKPYSDRSLICVLQGRSYLPVTINDALLLGTTKIVDTAGTSINGYRVGKRVVSMLNLDDIAMYTHTCSVIAATLDMLFERCTSLGYNVTHDYLRIVCDLESTTTRFVTPGSDGSACMFRLVGKYSEVKSAIPYLIAVNRTTRETETGAWLKHPGGKWRNGWYKGPDGAKWHLDMISNEKDSTLGIPLSQFNMLTGEELVCNYLMKCAAVFLDNWGSKFFAGRVIARTSIIVLNGKRYGFFQCHVHLVNTATSIYGWETLVSNTVTIRILTRWLVAMGTLHRGYFFGASQCHNIGIGCLANSHTFDYLPLMLLPRLKMALFVLWTSGCVFDDPQRALADTWFVMYPATVEVVVLYFSLLNLLAKLFRLRVSDVMFGPTLVLFCALNWLRDSLADSDWLEFDGRVTSAVSVSEFNAVTLVDFFTPSMALRTNENIKSIFYSKVLVSTASLLPFVWSLLRAKRTFTSDPMSRIEKALAVRFQNAGGLGHLDSYNLGSSVVLNSYEVIRFGYTVFGDSTNSNTYLIAFDDWDLVTLLASLCSLTHLWNRHARMFNPRETWRCDPRRSAR